MKGRVLYGEFEALRSECILVPSAALTETDITLEPDGELVKVLSTPSPLTAALKESGELKQPERSARHRRTKGSLQTCHW